MPRCLILSRLTLNEDIQLENLVTLSTTPQKVLKNKCYYPLQFVKDLTTSDVTTPQFHILPKIHKLSIPGRPVVSSVECHTSKISKFVDHYLKPHTVALPSYIKDPADFVNKINGEGISFYLRCKILINQYSRP